MEIEIINRPMFVIALSEKEAGDAVRDPSILHALLRRKWLEGQGHGPVQEIPKRTSSGSRQKREFHCPDCDFVSKREGTLKKHIGAVHAEGEGVSDNAAADSA